MGDQETKPPQPRPIAIETANLFPMIRSAAHSADCKLIAGKRCFVVPENVFLNVLSYFFVSGQPVEFDPRIASEGYDNFRITISARDVSAYYLAAKIDSLFDFLWSKKGPKEG